MLELSNYMNRGRYRSIDSKVLDDGSIAILAYERSIPHHPDMKPFLILQAKKEENSNYYVNDHGKHFESEEEAKEYYEKLE